MVCWCMVKQLKQLGETLFRSFAHWTCKFDEKFAAKAGIYDESARVETLDKDITLEEVKQVLKQIRRGKAVGADGIFNEILMYGGPHMSEALWRLCQELFTLEKVLSEWGRGLIYPLHKNGDRQDPNNYRGITLLSVVGKVFAAVINKRLSLWCEHNNKLAEEQAGFRPQRSTIDQLFIYTRLFRVED